jgi:hypothetical protein
LSNEILINTGCCRATKGIVSWINARMSRLEFQEGGEPHQLRERCSVRSVKLSSKELRWVLVHDSRSSHVQDFGVPALYVIWGNVAISRNKKLAANLILRHIRPTHGCSIK